MTFKELHGEQACDSVYKPAPFIEDKLVEVMQEAKDDCKANSLDVAWAELFVECAFKKVFRGK